MPQTGIPLTTGCTSQASAGSGYWWQDPNTSLWWPRTGWHDADFVRLPGTDRIVVACAPYACTGQGGSLRVYRYDQADPPEPESSVEIETEDVTGLSLTATGDGTLYLVYHKTTGWTVPFHSPLWWTKSNDGGLTWEAPTAIDLTATFQYVGEARERDIGAFVEPQAGRFLVRHWGRKPLGGAGTDAGFYLTVGLPDGSGGWTWQTPAAAGPGTFPNEPLPARTDLQLNVGTFTKRFQQLRSGRIFIWPGGTAGIRFLDQVNDDGTQTRDRSLVAVDNFFTAWQSEASGVAVFIKTTPNPLVGATETRLYWGTSRLGNDGELFNAIQTVDPFPPAPEEYITTYFIQTRTVGAFPNQQPTLGWMVARLQQDRRGIWELLRPDTDGALKFARCADMPAQAAGAVWVT